MAAGSGRGAVAWSAAAVAVMVTAYAGAAGRFWWRYGRRSAATRAGDRDALAEGLMPACDVVERHRISVNAPAPVVFASACEMRLMDHPLIRLIFTARERVLGARPAPLPPGRFVDQMASIGWGVLAEVPGRELVMGAATRPWEPNVVFRPLAPAEFAAFSEPGWVKILWTLRADPVTERSAIFRTETRAVATDPCARARFRRYWALAAPGIVLIRWLSLGPLKRDAERRGREGHGAPPALPRSGHLQREEDRRQRADG